MTTEIFESVEEYCESEIKKRNPRIKKVTIKFPNGNTYEKDYDKAEVKSDYVERSYGI